MDRTYDVDSDLGRRVAVVILRNALVVAAVFKSHALYSQSCVLQHMRIARTVLVDYMMPIGNDGNALQGPCHRQRQRSPRMTLHLKWVAFHHVLRFLLQFRVRRRCHK